MPKHQLCRNCGHEIDHNYCPACGQRTTTDRLTWASLVDSVSSTFIGDEAYGLRGINMRKGAVMTWLAILIHPYVSVSEFILGHRRKYFNPVAILLMLSTFYAVVFALVGKEFTPTARADSPLFRWLICSYYDYATLHPAANMLLMLPFYALAMKTVFRRRSDLKYVEYLYIGIFLSVLNVHVNRTPAELEVESKYYREGEFLDARHPECAVRNEAMTIAGTAKAGDVRFPLAIRQISGKIARKIVCPVDPGRTLRRGEVYGMIKFGSRTELYLPVDRFDIKVGIGDKVRGGETVVAAIRQESAK